MKTLYLVSLGCPKNLVDSEVMLAALERDGYETVEQPEDASVLLVNTCGFIQPAVEEAIDVILELAACKELNPAVRLVVTGCMVQRYGRSLLDELPEVDLFVGLDDFPRINQMLAAPAAPSNLTVNPGGATYVMDSSVTRRIATPFFRSYLKITEGCDNRCAYCMIPSIRGRLRSRTKSDLLVETKALERSGVLELSLIAQDLTAYGTDRTGEKDLVNLLSVLLKETGIPWFRLLYLYPASVTDDLLQLMAEQKRLLPYLDIPFQHVSDPVLTRMNRHYDRTSLDDLIDRVRRYLPGCALRTTLMVGFPGETEQDVDLMAEALLAWRLEHVGVFQYQDEEGSPAATFSGKVAEEAKVDRYQRIMGVQAAISAELQQRYVGGVEPVLIEGVSEESDLLLEGRTRFQAPEIDGCVYITAGEVRPGDIVAVRITEAHTYDLVGEVISKKINVE
ncbi:30S ribosomal protein S12 methylthiotransferase RimO [Desulfobulbus alkaliphilus]|uniref:30S ribosomal protein S12 methylthiotransferase RimO n=1 Tax=Desulfobulbus alkaliphilus TaxID=869814 RepID=UPI0019629C59|nr:30S ribosomal protein S12 methylthiotransferase RimO [Desulfobulbus alkaliphilus]MBM9536831.1 30S ribosomal protein S12 methylthiotransferase RimO [Desulfobulbus alkaliphilus]